MKNSILMSLPILYIHDGSIFQIAGSLINTENLTVTGLLIIDTENFDKVNFIAWQDIMSIGESMITVSFLGNMDKKEGISMTGIRAVDTSGAVSGVVTDFDIDEITGRLKSLFTDKGDEISTNTVVTLNKQFLIVNSDFKIEDASDYANIKRKLLGKISPKDIIDSAGNYLVKEGDIITSDIIEHSKKIGKIDDFVVILKK